MSIDVRIASAIDGKTATVVHPDIQPEGKNEKVHALAVNISGMDLTDQWALPVVQGTFGTPYEAFLEDAGSHDMTVNGSVTPVVFSASANVDSDIVISEFFIYGRDGSIKFSNWLGTSSALTNGLLIEAKSNNIAFSFPVVFTTGDLMAFSSSNSFSFYADTSSDVLKAVREDTFTLKKSGTFGPVANDDFFRVTVRDNLTQPDETYAGIRGVLR